MARASIGKELHFETADETGTLGFFTIALKDAGINIIHLLGYAVDGKAYFQIILSDPEKAKKILSNDIKNVVIRDVLIVEFENKAGTLSDVAKLLGQNNVGVSECYGTSSDGFKIVGVFMTDDNARAAKLINAQSGHLAP
jgi:hypothetical protein